MDKRYQVFVSSTYADLKDERQAVIRTLMEMDCIPAGMELFPAADEDQLEFIKKVIDDCDYYLIIIGGRYGSLTREGISYTEKEYEYAIERKLKVIALIHGSPEEIPSGKTDQDDGLRHKLQSFRNRVMTGRIVKKWNSADELPGLVALSLNKVIKMFPAVGWVRAIYVASENLLSEINDLRKENETLRDKLSYFKSLEKTEYLNIAGLDSTFVLHGKDTNKDAKIEIELTFKEIFFKTMQPQIIRGNTSIPYVIDTLANLMEKNLNIASVDIDSDDITTLVIQFKALGLIDVMGSDIILTHQGERLIIDTMVIRKELKQTLQYELENNTDNV